MYRASTSLDINAPRLGRYAIYDYIMSCYLNFQCSIGVGVYLSMGVPRYLGRYRTCSSTSVLFLVYHDT